ncbi:MAG TPA: hypothetical protein VFS24_15010 [Steroidobacteraceae bacterium]|nr:hypothetical protein [Steroidobacteraceae bacterium]
MLIRAAALAAIMSLLVACSNTPRAEHRDLSGRWLLTTTSKVGSQDLDLIIHQSGDELTGTVVSPMGEVPYTGHVNGTGVTFGFTLRAAGRDLSIKYFGQVEGDTMKGSTSFDAFGQGTFIAHRK